MPGIQDILLFVFFLIRHPKNVSRTETYETQSVRCVLMRCGIIRKTIQNVIFKE